MKYELIAALAEELGIPFDGKAPSLCRLIYSASGKMALASLWDHPEEENFVSVQHFKKRAVQILTAYCSIYPQVKTIFPEDLSDLAEDMYTIYLRNGFFYHASHKISPAPAKTCKYGNCVLYRDTSPAQKTYMSGLGLYQIQANTTTCGSVANMFDLPQQTLSQLLQEVLQAGVWNDVNWPEDSQFLRMSPPFSRGYWQEKPDKNNNISLARYGSPLPLYVFYRYKDGKFQQKQIPSWRIQDFKSPGEIQYGAYRRIANALLFSEKKLPPISATHKGNLMTIKLDYRLPPEEEDFFRLYGWPVQYTLSASNTQIFLREMSDVIYPIFKNHAESVGYCFTEE